jgi:hypothetical protein
MVCDESMLGTTGGELFLICFIGIAVVTARLWWWVGAAVGGLLAGPEHGTDSNPRSRESRADE